MATMGSDAMVLGGAAVLSSTPTCVLVPGEETVLVALEVGVAGVDNRSNFLEIKGDTDWHFSGCGLDVQDGTVVQGGRGVTRNCHTFEITIAGIGRPRTTWAIDVQHQNSLLRDGVFGRWCLGGRRS